MTIPQWTLLGFAAWTLMLLIAFVGVYRWYNILFSNARIASFRSDRIDHHGGASQQSGMNLRPRNQDRGGC